MKTWKWVVYAKFNRKWVEIKVFDYTNAGHRAAVHEMRNQVFLWNATDGAVEKEWR